MNKIIVFLACLILSINAFAQFTEPTPMQFKWGYDTLNYRVFVRDSFQQKSMALGFQWAGSRVFSNFLLHSTIAAHGYGEVAAGSRSIPLNFVNQPTWLDSGYYPIGAWFAPFPPSGLLS